MHRGNVSTSQESMSYYVRNRNSLLKDLDKVSRHVRKVLESEMDASQVNQIVTESRKEYDRIIPMIPDIQGRRIHFISIWLAAHGCWP